MLVIAKYPSASDYTQNESEFDCIVLKLYINII